MILIFEVLCELWERLLMSPEEFEGILMQEA